MIGQKDSESGEVEKRRRKDSMTQEERAGGKNKRKVGIEK